MKSFIFTTDNDRGGVMLCDIETIEDAVDYLNKRFPGIVKVEMGKDYWTVDGGFVEGSQESENDGSQALEQANSG